MQCGFDMSTGCSARVPSGISEIGVHHAWSVNAIAAPILVAFPTTRYVDTAAVLIPSLAIMALITVAKDFVPRARPLGHA